MKNLKIIGIAALILPLMFTLISCNENGNDPDSMTFENEEARFTINENFEFEVVFLADIMNGMLSKGQWVRGKVGEPTSSTWVENFTGEAHSMTTNSDFSTMMGTMKVSISLVYVKEGNNITSVNVIFPNAATNPLIDGMAQQMMGGTYERK